MSAPALMRAPFAQWPANARAAARELVATYDGLLRLRAQRNRKAWVVQWLIIRGAAT